MTGTALPWPPLPIEQAPVKEGEHYGPCLLTPGLDGNDWVVGEWDGYGWFTLDGDREIFPDGYWDLPPRPPAVPG